MRDTIIHIGLDVDDTSYHGAALNAGTGEVIEFRCRPTLKGLIGQLNKLRGQYPGATLKVCYEASYIGYCLQRDLTARGVHCDVVSPSHIPKPRGRAVKTDRIDAGQLAQFYAKDLLTVVDIPDAEQERDRDLMRSRLYLLHSQTKLRTHLHAVLRRNGLHYKAQTRSHTHWTQQHYGWLERTIEGLSGSLQVNLRLLLRQLKAINALLAEYDSAIEELARSPRYHKAVQALSCYKGIKHQSAMTMITEIGDIRRFSHPRKLVSWMGMDIREYSSGAHQHRFGITGQGNRYLRTAFIGANQRGYRTTRISKDLKARRANADPELVEIADRCLHRLSKKGNRLLLAGKHPNKVKVACAREMVGFVWESLHAAGA